MHFKSEFPFQKISFPFFKVEHPAAKMIAMAAGMMQQEVGDGTNFVVLLCGALLKEAEDLIRMGLKPVDVIEGNECLKIRKLWTVQGTFLIAMLFLCTGYEIALKKTLELLESDPDLVCAKVDDLKSKEQTVRAIRTALMSKLYGYEDDLAGMVFEACKKVMDEKNQVWSQTRISVSLSSG